MQRLVKSEYLLNAEEEDNSNPKFSVCFVELATYLEDAFFTDGEA